MDRKRRVSRFGIIHCFSIFRARYFFQKHATFAAFSRDIEHTLLSSRFDFKISLFGQVKYSKRKFHDFDYRYNHQTKGENKSAKYISLIFDCDVAFLPSVRDGALATTHAASAAPSSWPLRMRRAFSHTDGVEAISRSMAPLISLARRRTRPLLADDAHTYLLSPRLDCLRIGEATSFPRRRRLQISRSLSDTGRDGCERPRRKAHAKYPLH